MSRKSILAFLLIYLISNACLERIEQAPNTATTSINRQELIAIQLDTKMDYFKELQRLLKLSEEDISKIKTIIIEHRKARKDIAGNELELLVAKREKDLATVLTPTQMAQKSHVDFKYYNANIKSPKALLNIQKQLKLSDGQILKYLEVTSKYKKPKKRLELLKQFMTKDQYEFLINIK